MALLVFLTFLSVITNQYVPVWMKDQEASHMSDALGQMGKFKSNIDLQILVATAAQLQKSPYVPVTTFAIVKLGVGGVPIFAGETTGTLLVDQGQSLWTVWFHYSLSGNDTLVPEADCNCGGLVRLHVLNRYYVPQDLAYENGALIRAQPDGQLVKGEPSFRVAVGANGTSVDFGIVQMFGNGGISGSGAEGLLARVVSADLQTYTQISTNIFANATTVHGPAWYRFLNQTLSVAYGVDASKYNNPAYPDFTHSELYSGSQPTQLRVDNPIYLIQSFWNDVAKNYNVTLEFKRPQPGNSVLVLPVTAFTLIHTYVNVAVGQRGNEVGI